MFFKALIALAASTSLVVPAMAQDRPVELASSLQLVVPADQAKGTPEQLVAANSVVPLDQLVFAVSYRNTSGEAVSDLLIVNPVPASVRVADQAASTTEVSVDGGTSWGKLSDLVVARADGTKTPATADDISHMRWKIARIGAGESGSVSFRATVR